MKKKKIILYGILLVILIVGLIIPMPEVNYNNSSIPAFSDPNYILGTSKKGENFLIIIYKGISTTLIVSIVAAIISILINIIFHILVILNYSKSKVINWLSLFLAELSNLTPLLLIVIIVSSLVKIELWLLSIIISISLFSVSYRLTANSFEQLMEEPSTLFAINNKFKKTKIIKNYYFTKLKSNLISVFLILLVFATGIEINVGYLRYGLDINKYYSFGRIVQENIGYLGTSSSLGIIIPITIITLFLFYLINLINNYEKTNND
jgi:ABC-type dipeptide/oligopeptide/nickel transport system permease subunit